VQPPGERRGGVGHRGDGGAAVTGLGERGEVGARPGGHLLAGDVGFDTRWLEGANVGEQDVDPGVAQAIAQVGVLLALGVERADQQDGRNQR
jgi:hypothetical protein